MSETLLFGALRIVRLFVGMWAAVFFVSLVFGIGALAHIHDQGGRFFAWLLQLVLFLVALAIFYGLRQLIHMLHRQSFDAPHPKLAGFFSL